MLAINGDPNNDETWNEDNLGDDEGDLDDGEGDLDDGEGDLDAWRVHSIEAETGMMKWRFWRIELDVNVNDVSAVPDLRDDRTHQLVRQKLLATTTPDSAALLDHVDRARGARPLLGGARS